MKKVKKYRVNAEESYNLMCLHDELAIMAWEMEHGVRPMDYDVLDKYEELETLPNRVGDLADGPTLARIREICAARQMMRDQMCAANREAARG